MKAELLAMLAVKGVDINKVPGGIPAITQMDVAAMLRKCTPFEAAFLRAKYAGETESRHKAWAYWLEELMEKGWSVGDGRVEIFTSLTLDRAINPGNCPQCKGVKTVIINHKPVTCSHCNEYGREPYSERKMARAMHLGNRLGAEWSDRFAWGERRLIQLENSGLASIAY